ncbi:MAG: ADP-glyceromanno-heptose 6-epimerase [Sphingobacteriaceae bacterium]|nr:ADP-glyceromanno-heptose 6-epimerase [Sphingobacteriaceae bacterium]
MIVVTGAAGFIGSCLVAGLNEAGYNDLVLVDDFSRADKLLNYSHKRYSHLIPRDDFFAWLEKEQASVQYIFHLGARTDTTEFDVNIHTRLNFEYSKDIWLACVRYGIPLVYASSAATYGDGAYGFDDEDAEILPKLKPLNPYGDSKQAFDLWALSQEKKPYQWVGLKFFNVYGPNEYHKGRMASVIFHAYNQILATKRMSLFRSHRSDYADGGQLRDFIYVKDVVKVCLWLMQHRKVTGLYNLGTGQARTFVDLAKGVFKAMGVVEQISFVDTPADIREKYQYFTEAKMDKLQKAGYPHAFVALEAGIHDYVVHYLTESKHF